MHGSAFKPSISLSISAQPQRELTHGMQHLQQQPGATCRDAAVAAAACSAVAAVVAADTAGETLLEVVQLVADLVKARDCRCKPEVVHFPMQ